jgi:hypothetical protein
MVALSIFSAGMVLTALSTDAPASVLATLPVLTGSERAVAVYTFDTTVGATAILGTCRAVLSEVVLAPAVSTALSAVLGTEEAVLAHTANAIAADIFDTPGFIRLGVVGPCVLVIHLLDIQVFPSGLIGLDIHQICVYQLSIRHIDIYQLSVRQIDIYQLSVRQIDIRKICIHKLDIHKICVS